MKVQFSDEDAQLFAAICEMSDEELAVFDELMDRSPDDMWRGILQRAPVYMSAAPPRKASFLETLAAQLQSMQQVRRSANAGYVQQRGDLDPTQLTPEQRDAINQAFGSEHLAAEALADFSKTYQTVRRTAGGTVEVLPLEWVGDVTHEGAELVINVRLGIEEARRAGVEMSGRGVHLELAYGAEVFYSLGPAYPSVEGGSVKLDLKGELPAAVAEPMRSGADKRVPARLVRIRIEEGP